MKWSLKTFAIATNLDLFLLSCRRLNSIVTEEITAITFLTSNFSLQPQQLQVAPSLDGTGLHIAPSLDGLDLPIAPSLGEGTLEPNFNLRICHKFQVGLCKRGSSCKYAHILNEVPVSEPPPKVPFVPVVYDQDKPKVLFDVQYFFTFFFSSTTSQNVEMNYFLFSLVFNDLLQLWESKCIIGSHVLWSQNICNVHFYRLL